MTEGSEGAPATPRAARPAAKDHAPKGGHAARKRASKRQLRITAWLAGGLAFATPFGALAAAPKATTQPEGDVSRGRRPLRIVRHVTRRIVVVHPAAPQPGATFVAPSSPGATSTSPTTAASDPPPPPPPTTSSGGS